jgi:hypothetical protein
MLAVLIVVVARTVPVFSFDATAGSYRTRSFRSIVD